MTAPIALAQSVAKEGENILLEGAKSLINPRLRVARLPGFLERLRFRRHRGVTTMIRGSVVSSSA
jgi:hypothetical protein